MDLQLYYGKMRQEEQRIGEEFPVICSHETADGGKAGRWTEVPRRIAARFIVQGLARLATHEESKIFRDVQNEAKRVADELLETAKQSAALLLSHGIAKLQDRVRAKEAKE